MTSICLHTSTLDKCIHNRRQTFEFFTFTKTKMRKKFHWRNECEWSVLIYWNLWMCENSHRSNLILTRSRLRVQSKSTGFSPSVFIVPSVSILFDSAAHAHALGKYNYVDFPSELNCQHRWTSASHKFCRRHSTGTRLREQCTKGFPNSIFVCFCFVLFRLLGECK